LLVTMASQMLAWKLLVLLLVLVAREWATRAGRLRRRLCAVRR
jgi:hypothetical protein